MQKQSNKKFWDGEPIYVGIDSHKKNWIVTIMSSHNEHKTFNQDANPEVLASYLKKNFPGAEYRSVYEAGFSGFWASKMLKDLGINNIIVNAADVPTMHKEQVNKNDAVDSRKLARSLRSGELRAIYEPDELILSVRQFIRRRGQLVKDLAREKNRLKSFFFFIGHQIPSQFNSSESRQFSRRYVAWLEGLSFHEPAHTQTLESSVRCIQNLRKELLLVNREIRRLSNLPQLKQDMELLLSIPGIGLLSAITFLTEVAPMERFRSSDELNSYIGLVPSVHSSGDRENVGKLTSRGNSRLLHIIIECSWTLVRQDPAMLHKFESLAKKMEKNKAIIRIARKLLNRIRRVLLTKEPYQLGVYE
jgi:transposase